MPALTLALAGATAAAAWTVPKILDALSSWWSGNKGKQARQNSSRGPQATQMEGMKSIGLPGGDVLHQIEKHNPGITAAIQKNQASILEHLSKSPEKWPGAQDFMAQANESLSQQGIPGQADWQSPDFAGMTNAAMNQFQGQILPGLAERFTSMTGGGQRSGAFARQTTGASERLAEVLHAQQGKMTREDQMARADYGLKRGVLGMQQAQFGADIYGKGRQAESDWLSNNMKMLQGDMPTTYDTVKQPAQARQPGWQDYLYPEMAKQGTKAMSTYGLEGAKWLGNTAVNYITRNAMGNLGSQ